MSNIERITAIPATTKRGRVVMFGGSRTAGKTTMIRSLTTQTSKRIPAER